MLLYANVASERATKGQGGNEFIAIELLNKGKELVYSIEYSQEGLTVYDESARLLFEAKGKQQ